MWVDMFVDLRCFVVLGVENLDNYGQSLCTEYC